MFSWLLRFWKNWREARRNRWYEAVATSFLVEHYGLTEEKAKAASRNERVRECIDSILAIDADEWKHHKSRKMRELNELALQV